MKKWQRYGVLLLTFLMVHLSLYATQTVGVQPMEQGGSEHSPVKVITTPLDSRPISIEYLENLVYLGGDTFESVGKGTLDYFPSVDGMGSRFADSYLVRSNFNSLMAKAVIEDKQEVVAIINLASYLNGGLIGSRCASNYTNLEAGYADLHTLVSAYPEATYYLHLTMPRTLPETRNNSIWPNNERIKGLGAYYLEHNLGVLQSTKAHITSQFSYVTPEQFLMEWSYVENKKEELGEWGLAAWERAFLEESKVYTQNPYYHTYLENYKKPFEGTFKTFEEILLLQQQGLVEEIILSTDDFQLPDSILYLFKNTQDQAIQVEAGTPIKYSFARTYMKKIEQKIIQEKNDTALQLAKLGLNENLNFIYGTDEIPQLIYARDLSKRTGKTTHITTFSQSDTNVVGRYDVYTPNQLLQSALNFVSEGDVKTQEVFDLYLYDYQAKSANESILLTQMMESISKGQDFGLIEVYSENVLSQSSNTLFQKLMSGSWGITLADLSSYSAWNTNANAIGLGVAHTQVYGIANQMQENREIFVQNQLEMLLGHILEDGLFTAQGKAILRDQAFIPSYRDMIQSTKLLEVLRFEEVKRLFSLYEKDGVQVHDIALLQYKFPWGRNFECFLEIGVLTK